MLIFDHKPVSQTLEDYFTDKFSGRWADNFTTEKVLSCQVVGESVFLAIRRRNKGGEVRVYAAECSLINIKSKGPHNIGYHYVDESYGFNLGDGCPLSIIEMLTPGGNPEWRNRCKVKAEALKAGIVETNQTNTDKNNKTDLNNSSKLKVGDVVTFTSPLKFSDGSVCDIFKALSLRPLDFISITGNRVKITKKFIEDMILKGKCTLRNDTGSFPRHKIDWSLTDLPEVVS